MEYDQLKEKVLQLMPNCESIRFTLIYRICDFLNDLHGYKKFHSICQILYDDSHKKIIDPAECFFDKTETYFQGLSSLIDNELLLYKINLLGK